MSALLVTWTGLGGHGKMRLAIESTAPLREEFNERVWFVPLADVSDARLILDAVIDALRLPHAPNV